MTGDLVIYDFRLSIYDCYFFKTGGAETIDYLLLTIEYFICVYPSAALRAKSGHVYDLLPLSSFLSSGCWR